MPVIILIGEASRFESDISEFFRNKYEIDIPTGEFPSIRSYLSNQDPGKLYIISNIEKPERYEIFCLSKKNEQQFLSISLTNRENVANSDKNVIFIDDFDGSLVSAELDKSWLSKTSATKRSKCISLKSLSDLKTMINKVNQEFLSVHKGIEFILADCENRILKIGAFQTTSSLESFEECYRKMVENELNAKGFF